MTQDERAKLVAELREAPTVPSAYKFSDRNEDLFDIGLRHKSGIKPDDRLRLWLSAFRPFAYATRDDSWGELEKEICIVLNNYVRLMKLCDRAADLLESHPTPPNGFTVSDDMVERAARAIVTAQGYSNPDDMVLLPGQNEVPRWRLSEDHARTALTAALNPIPPVEGISTPGALK